MKPFIQNVSMSAVSKGLHYYVPHKTALIQIQDYYGVMHFAKPVYPFVKVLRLRFDDEDVPNLESNITQQQAKAIGDFLKECLEAEINVVVHCNAGLYRSGAVAECGVILGFQDGKAIRIPNTLVKKLILEELGMSNSYARAESEGLGGNEPVLTEEQKFHLGMFG
jgi:predicted protein tyrosine phosphatase